MPLDIPNVGDPGPGYATRVNTALSTLDTNINNEIARAEGVEATKATDSLVAHLAGTETITGAKTFNANTTLTDGVNIVIGSTNGTQIGTATTQKIGFYGVTPKVQPAGSADLGASLAALGLVGAISNPPLNLGTGTLTAGTINVTDLEVSASNPLIDIVHTGGTTNDKTLRITFGGDSAVFQSINDDGSLKFQFLNFDLANSRIKIPDVNIELGTTTGTKIGTATTQLLGFWNVTPAVQPTAGTDVVEALISVGLLAEGENWPLNLGTGALVAGSATVNGATVGTVTTPLAKSGNYTMATIDTLILATAGSAGFTVTLPVSPVQGRRYGVKKVDSGAGNITVKGSSGNIDNSALDTISTQYDSRDYMFDGTNWWRV